MKTFLNWWRKCDKMVEQAARNRSIPTYLCLYGFLLQKEVTAKLYHLQAPKDEGTELPPEDIMRERVSHFERSSKLQLRDTESWRLFIFGWGESQGNDYLNLPLHTCLPFPPRASIRQNRPDKKGLLMQSRRGGLLRWGEVWKRGESRQRKEGRFLSLLSAEKEVPKYV